MNSKLFIPRATGYRLQATGRAAWACLPNTCVSHRPHRFAVATASSIEFRRRSSSCVPFHLSPVACHLWPQGRHQLIHHYLLTALRHFRQHKLTTGINVMCLALGLMCFMLAWGTVTWFEQRDRYHARADRTYFVSWNAAADRNAPPDMTGPFLLAPALSARFPQLEAVARLAGESMGVTHEDRSYWAAISFADPEFLDIFDIPLIGTRGSQALRQPRSAVVSRALANADVWDGERRRSHAAARRSRERDDHGAHWRHSSAIVLRDGVVAADDHAGSGCLDGYAHCDARIAHSPTGGYTSWGMVSRRYSHFCRAACERIATAAGSERAIGQIRRETFPGDRVASLPSKRIR